jgi:hypothetical protein
MKDEVGFSYKFLRSWIVLGGCSGLIVGLANLSSQGFGVIFAGPLLGIFISFFYGGLGMLFDAGMRHKWKFSNIQHSLLAWHLYPVIGFIDIVLSVTIGILWGAVRSTFK